MSSNLNGSSFFYKNGMDRKAMGSRPISPPLILSSFLFLNINISKKATTRPLVWHIPLILDTPNLFSPLNVSFKVKFVMISHWFLYAHMKFL